MITTDDLISKYVKSVLSSGYKDLRIEDYNINGSIIFINYNYLYDWGNDSTDRSYGNILTVDLLEYITFIFNSFSRRI